MQRDPVEFMERMMSSYSKVHTARYWTQITPFIEEIEKRRVLDIGCGPGLLLEDILERFNFQQAFGLDLSQVMLDRAKEVHKKHLEEGRIDFILQHMQENPHLPNNLDLVLSSRVMRSFENLPEVMQAVYHSLNENGIFILLDWAQGSIDLYEQYLRETRNREYSAEEIIKYHRNFSRYTLDDWGYIFTATGFDVIHSFAVNEVLNCIIGEKK